MSYNFNSSLTMDSCWCEYTLVTIDNETTDPPNKYYLFQNYPNPFNPTTTIAYAIPERGIVSLKVYDVLGREIETLVNDYKRSGQYEVNFDATHQSSGVYFYTLQAGNYRDIKKMLLLR